MYVSSALPHPCHYGSCLDLLVKRKILPFIHVNAVVFSLRNKDVLPAKEILNRTGLCEVRKKKQY